MKKILLIEDNFEIRENSTELLELEGYEVVTAKDGRLGLEIAKEMLPGLILCDIMMPEMDGYAVFKALKADKPTADIPFVFVTASVEQKEMRAALDMGVDAYLRKPYQEEELFELVARYLKK